MPTFDRRVPLRLAAFATLALSAPVALGGCGYLIPHSAPPPVASAGRAHASQPMVAFYANMLGASEGPNGDCDRMIDDKSAALAAAADKALHDSPRPGMQVPPPSALFARLRAEHVSFALGLGPTGAPSVEDTISSERAQWRVPPQNAKERSEYEAFRAKDGRAGWVVDELRLEILGFGQAFLGAHYVADSSRSGAGMLARLVWSMQDAGVPDELVARGHRLLKKDLRCMHRGTSLEAAATGVFAAYQAAASGDHPEIADKTISALAQVLPVQDDATDAEVDAELDAIGREVKDAHARAGVTAPQGPFAFQSPQPQADGAPNVASFLPAGSPARQVADGAEAALHGDYRAAIRTVARFAPGPLGTVLGLAGGLLGR